MQSGAINRSGNKGNGRKADREKKIKKNDDAPFTMELVENPEPQLFRVAFLCLAWWKALNHWEAGPGGDVASSLLATSRSFFPPSLSLC